ncbi:MAG: hypothetical protein ACTSYF_07300 [Promethearchaeota archaeon]
MERQRIKKYKEKIQDVETNQISTVKQKETIEKSINAMKRRLEDLKMSLEIPENIVPILHLNEIQDGTLEEQSSENEVISKDDVISQPVDFNKIESKPVELESSSYSTLCILYPWLNDLRFEFMYSPPVGKKKKEKEYKEWLEEWSKVLFDYAKTEKRHVIFVNDIIGIRPFSEIRQRKDSLIEIINALIRKKNAKWIKKNEKVRIYWKSLEEWSEIIYEWAYENSILEPLFVFNLKEVNEDFSTLPEEEFISIMKLLEKKDKGHIIKASDGKIAIKFNF